MTDVDIFVGALWHSAKVVVGVASTTELCATAAKVHGLRATGRVAMGRLLTCAALLRFVTPRFGALSLQVLCEGSLRQLFADVDAVDGCGHLRGYCRGQGEALAPASTVRPSVCKDIGGGMLSVLRADAREGFIRSATPLTSCEVDDDVAYYAENSEQIPTVLACDVGPDPSSGSGGARGVIAQGLPGADLEALAALQRQLKAGGLEAAVRHGESAQQLLGRLAPQAQIQQWVPLYWRCRCSRERATAALRMLPPEDVRDMATHAEPTRVDCEFCHTVYEISPAELQALAGSQHKDLH